MTIGGLRKVIIWAMLALTGSTMLFFVLAPALDYPLEPDQGWAIAQVSVPVFVGYLGTATQFALLPERAADKEPRPMLAMVVLGSLAIYAVGAVTILFAFWLTNRVAAPIDTGMSTKTLSTVLTSLLGVLTVVGNIAVAQMFKRQDDRP